MERLRAARAALEQRINQLDSVANAMTGGIPTPFIPMDERPWRAGPAADVLKDAIDASRLRADPTADVSYIDDYWGASLEEQKAVQKASGKRQRCRLFVRCEHGRLASAGAAAERCGWWGRGACQQICRSYPWSGESGAYHRGRGCDSKSARAAMEGGRSECRRSSLGTTG